MTDQELEQLALEVSQFLITKRHVLAVAESCTGGWLAKLLTDIAGSSEWFDRGFVTYSNQAKQDMLGVTTTTLKENGAVSQQTVKDMVAGVLEHSMANVAVAVSGIAGPGGGSNDKPVGTVCFAWSKQGADPVSELHHFLGDREQVRRASVKRLLTGMLEYFE